MNTLLYELPLGGKTLLSSHIDAESFWEDYETPVKLKKQTKEYNDKVEFTEIDPFTGQIRIIRR